MAISNVLALDVGTRRIGVAMGNTLARIASPLTTVENGPLAVQKLYEIIKDNQIKVLVVGLPRNQQGEETAQTTFTRHFAAEIGLAVGIPVRFQDESLTSILAERTLAAQKKKAVSKGDIDSMSAALILDDYFSSVSDPNA